MNTDELVDARLSEHGREWRAAHARPAEVDLAALSAPPAVTRRPGNRSLLAIAGAVAAAAAVVAALLVVGGRSHKSTPPADPITGVTWSIVDLRPSYGDGTPGLGPDLNNYFSIDSKGRISGSTGCNPFSGSAKVGARTIELSGLAFGATVCTDSPTKGVWLVKEMHWSFADGRLALAGANGTIVATPAPITSQPQGLVGTDWQITDADVAGIPRHTIIPSDLRWYADGHFTLEDGCDSLYGLVHLAAGTMRFSVVGNAPGAPTPCYSPDKLSQLVRALFSGTTRWTATLEPEPRQGGFPNRLVLSKPGVGSITFGEYAGGLTDSQPLPTGHPA